MFQLKREFYLRCADKTLNCELKTKGFALGDRKEFELKFIEVYEVLVIFGIKL